MKRILTLFFLLAGIAFAHSAYAQDGGKKKKKSKKTEQSGTNREQPSGGGATGSAPDEIAIDEGGTPKVKKSTTNSQSAPTTAGDTIPKNKKADRETSERAPAPPAGSPEPIAIDEGGTPKVKKPATASGSNPSSSDSVIKAPAELIGRPQD
jgi:hypothetical protein